MFVFFLYLFFHCTTAWYDELSYFGNNSFKRISSGPKGHTISSDLLVNGNYIVEKNGVEYLRLNGTDDLWACSKTNLCDRIRALEQKQAIGLTATKLLPQTLNDYQNSLVVFDTVSDISGRSSMYSNTTGVFTVPTTGWYYLSFEVGVQVGYSMNYVYWAYIITNGTCDTGGSKQSLTVQSSITNNYYPWISAGTSAVWPLDEGTTVITCLNVRTGASKQLDPYGSYNSFHVYLIR